MIPHKCFIKSYLLLITPILVMASCGKDHDKILPGLSFTEELSIVGDGTNPEKSFLRAYDSSVGPEGNIYVAGYRIPRVYVYSPDGSFVHSFGKQGRGPGEFLLPRGSALIDSTYYIWDQRQRRMSWFSLSGEHLGQQVSKDIYSPVEIFELGDQKLLMYADRFRSQLSKSQLAHVYSTNFANSQSDFLRVGSFNEGLEDVDRALASPKAWSIEVLSPKRVLFVPRIYSNAIFEYVQTKSGHWELSKKHDGLFRLKPYSITEEKTGRSPDRSYYSAHMNEPLHLIIHNQSRGLYKVRDHIFHFIQIDRNNRRVFGAEVFTSNFNLIGFIPIKSIPITNGRVNNIDWYVDEADQKGNFYFREIYQDSSRIRKMHLDLNELHVYMD